jgi:hypothetical protein
LKAVALAAVAIAVVAPFSIVAIAEAEPTVEAPVASPVVVAQAAVKPAKPAKPKSKCRNSLAKVLKTAGFRGKDLQFAWAISMRESGGNPKAISRTGDYGLMQINKAAWSRQPWWDSKKLLTAQYNADIAFKVISERGITFRAWGIDGQGRKHTQVSYAAGVYEAFRKNLPKFPKECF